MFGLLAVLFFNMIMSLTLVSVVRMCGEKYGLAFGLTTFALAIGFIPTIFCGGKLFCMPFILAGVLLAIIFMLLGHLPKRKGCEK